MELNSHPITFDAVRAGETARTFEGSNKIRCKNRGQTTQLQRGQK